MTAAFVVHLATTWALVGLIWCVQLLIYPQFHCLAPARFRQWHEAHCTRISFLVIPLMLLEVASMGWLFLAEHLRTWWFTTSCPLLALVWLSTAVWQAPIHTKLPLVGYDKALVEKLVRTNWVRTACWTLRGLLLLTGALEWPLLKL